MFRYSLGIELEVEFVEPVAGVVERAVCAFEGVQEHDEGRFHHLLFFFLADAGFEGLVGIERAPDDFAGGDLFFCGQLFELFAVAVAEQDYGSAVCALGFCRGCHVLNVAHVHGMCIRMIVDWWQPQPSRGQARSGWGRAGSVEAEVGLHAFEGLALCFGVEE